MRLKTIGYGQLSIIQIRHGLCVRSLQYMLNGRGVYWQWTIGLLNAIKTDRWSLQYEYYPFPSMNTRYEGN